MGSLCLILITRQPAPPVKMVAHTGAPRNTAAGGDSASVGLVPAPSALPTRWCVPFCLPGDACPSCASLFARNRPRARPGIPGAALQPARSAAHLRGALSLAWPGCVLSACSWAALTLTATLNLES